MGIVAEFARYKATLRNRFYDISAEVGSETVLSLWRHRISVEGGRWIYRDHLSRWSGLGNEQFARHLRTAFNDGRLIRVVVATTDDAELVEAGGDASTAKNTFKARPDWVGRVEAFDGDHFTIGFDRV
jgi:putative restriction endonuclease